MRSFLEKHVWVKRAFLIVGAYLCILALAKVISLHGDGVVFWGGQYFGYNMWSVILFGVTIWLSNRFIKRGGRRQSVFSCVGGFIVSIAIVYGAYVHYVNDIYRSVGETFLQIGMIFSLLMITAPLISELFVFLDKAQEWYHAKGLADVQHPRIYFGVTWAIIFVCYIPLFLATWPGNFIYDAKYQLQNVIEGYYFTHHPLIHTLMLGKAYEFGQSIGDVSSGVQLYTLAQMLVLTSSFAYCLLYMYKKRVPRCIRVCVLLWFALFPMHALFAITATKDVLCAAFFLYFMIFLVRFVWDKETFRWYSYVGMVISGVLLSLFRNNALYAVLVTGILLILFIKGWKNKGKLLGMFVCILLLAKLANQGMIAYTNATTNDTYRESLSVPLQCLARVVAYRGDELAPELYEEICAYMPEYTIVTYNPYISDYVKNSANEQLLEDNFVNFIKLWVKVGLQFPDEYIESIVTNTMGYWYPLNQGIYVSMDISLYHTLIGMGDEIEKRCYCRWAETLYNRLFWTNDYHYVPLLGYAFRSTPYVWILLLYMLWSLYKKDKARLQVGLLPLMYFATCLLGPMVALRYIYNIIVCVPLLVYVVLAQKPSQELEKQDEETENEHHTTSAGDSAEYR